MKPASLSILAIVFACLAVACGGKHDLTVTGTAKPAPTATTASQANICAANPSPAQTGLNPTDFGYRKLTQPTASMVVHSPLVISGDANPFEGAFGATIFGAGGLSLASMDFFKDNQQLAFSVQLPFNVGTQTQACLWVFERSGKDGSPINITQVPVVLQP